MQNLNVNKYEAAGIALSVAFMVLALFLIRVESAPDRIANLTADEQKASVIVATEGDQTEALRSAINNSTDGRGSISKLIVDDVVLGEGDPVEEGDTVTVHYIGALQNGQQFDNSKERGEPFTFKVGAGKVIPGWEEGILGMKAGGSRVLVIPADMAYGKDGFGPIPPNATLVFSIELLSIE